MSQPSAQVTAAEISRIAGVTRATVSNWRRRHDDFPAPSGGTESSPLYDLDAVRAWLTARGHTSAASPTEELRTTLRLHARSSGGTSDLLLLVWAAGRQAPAELTAFAGLPDTELAARAERAVAELADKAPGTVPDAETVRFAAEDAAVLRALLLCVRDEGGEAALEVLAERELEDSASSGTYRTPAPLADLVARLVPGSPARVLDPACGSGTFLAAAARRGAVELYGQDALPVQARRSAVALALEAPGAGTTVRTGDSLRADAFPELAADAVLCNPPYGDRAWGHDELAYDPRWAYGLPARADSELAWAQHALAHLTPGGHAVLVLPPATAARASGRRVRAELVRNGALRAVLSLPSGAAPPLHVGLHIWVLQRPDPGGPERGSVLFVDTADAAPGTGTGNGTADATPSRTRGGGRTALDWAAVTGRALTAWTAFTKRPEAYDGEPGTARAVTVVDLLDDTVDLTPARHVRASRAGLAPEDLSAETEATRAALITAATSLGRAADGLAWNPAGPAARAWRTATASDLARGGALELLRTVPDGAKQTPRTGAGKAGRTRPVPGTGGADAAKAGPPPEAAHAVFTGPDIARGTGPTGDPAELRSAAPAVVAAGDVLVRGAVTAGGGPMAVVAGEAEAGALLGAHVHLFRPDPARLDSWFLAGFLGAGDNIAGASMGSSGMLHVRPGRLRVPLLPLEEQRRYGEAFRRVHELRAEARRATRLAEETARLLAGGLTGGQLLPAADTTARRSSGADSSQ